MGQEQVQWDAVSGSLNQRQRQGEFLLDDENLSKFIDRQELIKREREGRNLTIGKRIIDGPSFYKDRIKWIQSPGVSECVSLECICVYMCIPGVCASVCVMCMCSC